MVINSQLEADFKEQFTLFTENKNKISLPQIYKWFKQAKLFDGCTSTKEVETNFNTFSRKKIEYDAFTNYLDSLFEGKNEKLPFDDVIQKLICCGAPGPKKTIVRNGCKFVAISNAFCRTLLELDARKK